MPASYRIPHPFCPTNPPINPEAPSGYCRALATLLLLLSASASVQARILYSYDQDSLVYMAEHVIEGTIGPKSRQHNYEVWDVTVTKVHKGDKAAGDHLQVTALDFYTKGVGDDVWKRGSTASLSDGDHVFLFLVQAKGTFLYDIPDDAKVYGPVPSGVKLVVNETVYGFSQWMSNPGPYLQETGKCFSGRNVGVLAFRKALEGTVTKMRELKDRIARAADSGDVRFMQECLKKRCADVKFGGRWPRDHVRELLCAMLANTHNIQAIDDVLEFDTFDILRRGFGSPKGRDFLLQRIASGDCSQEQKLRYASALHSAGHIYNSTLSGISADSWKPVGEPGPDNDWYLSRIAELAVKCVREEPVCEALTVCLGRHMDWILQTEHKVFEPDIQRSLAVLRELYKGGVSENLQYHIEVATAGADLKAYNLLATGSGPVICILRPADPKKYTRGSASRLIFEYNTRQIEEGIFVPLTVLQNMETGETTVVKTSKVSFGPQRSGCGGSDSVEIPGSVTPGKYRVYYQFEQNGKVVGVSHYLETTLPHGAGVQEPGAKE